MVEHRYPQNSTIKRLFAVSGNQCAFEKCELTLVDKESGKVTGKICHINARRENGPRFDEFQTEAQNMAFENLILMCPIHHDVIDADVKSYTKERLLELKKSHEEKGIAATLDLDDNKVEKLVQNIKIDELKIGSYFSVSYSNYNQVAEYIVNNNYDSSATYLLERYVESLKSLEAISNYMTPKKTFQEMEWDDALIIIATRFGPIRDKINAFTSEFAGFYTNEVEAELKNCAIFCADGELELDALESGAASDANQYAEKLHACFLDLLAKHKLEVKDKILARI